MARKEGRSWKPTETVDLQRPKEAAAWAAFLGASVDELHAVVAEVGPRAAAVATAFGRVVKIPPRPSL
jgi:uroporphyrinogen-III synthase